MPLNKWTKQETKIIILGLGNPGKKYQNTRHNIGRALVKTWAEKLSLTWQREKIFSAEIAKKGRLWLVKPTTMMNQSGQTATRLIKANQLITDPSLTLKQIKLLSASQGAAKNNSPLAKEQKKINLLVVHDELDLRLGQWRLSWGKSSPLHKGVLSIEQALQTKAFWRLRIGVDNRNPENRLPGQAYVLQKFLPKEKKSLKIVFKEILIHLEKE